MKQLLFIGVALLILTTGVRAETINIGNIENIYTANILTGSSNNSNCNTTPDADNNCDFERTFYSGTYLNDTALNDIVTSDFRTSAKSPVNNDAFIELAFTDAVVNGAGDDLVLFFIGNTTSFGLNVNIDGGWTGQTDYTIATPVFDTELNTVSDYGDTVLDIDNNWLCINSPTSACTNGGGFALSAISIDFGESYEGAAIESLRISLQNSNFSLAGGLYTDATVVPLPLSAVLFSSGLAFLGWIGRRKPV